jgi:O-antigen ligase
MRRLFLSVDLLRLERILWALVLVLLPVTSFRYLPFFGDSQVKPLSFFPAVLLLFLVLLRCFREKRVVFWNSALLLLLAFMLVAMISSALGGFLAPPDLNNYAYASRVLRAWVTLGVGVVFFVLPISMVRDEDDLRFTLKWLFIGLAGHLVWSLAQLVEIYLTSVRFEDLPLGNVIDTIQRTVMMAGITPNRRISGLALEPSWLAAQMAVLYLPWVFAGLFKGYSFSRYRWLTPVLLVAILALTMLTYSRSGIFIILLSAGLTLVFTGREYFSRSMEWLFQPFRRSACIEVRKFTQVALRFMILLMFVGLLVGSVFLLSQNKYFSSLWQVRTSSITDYFVGIYAGPRLAFSWAGWEIFTSHPWFGVGLGASGFYLHAALPDWSHFNLSEISFILSPEYTGFPNVKNLYLRILAEGGITGFWIWISFYLLILSRILSLFRSTRKFILFTGVAGVFIWFSILILNFSLDSLAMPLIWLPFGIVLGLQEGNR